MDIMQSTLELLWFLIQTLTDLVHGDQEYQRHKLLVLLVATLLFLQESLMFLSHLVFGDGVEIDDDSK